MDLNKKVLCQNVIIRSYEKGMKYLQGLKEKNNFDRIQYQILDLTCDDRIKDLSETCFNGVVDYHYYGNVSLGVLINSSIKTTNSAYVNWINSDTEVKVEDVLSIIGRQTLPETFIVNSMCNYGNAKVSIQPYAYKGSTSVNLRDDYRRLLLCLDPYFFPYEYIKDVVVSPEIFDSAMYDLIMQVLITNHEYSVYKETMMIIREAIINIDCENINTFQQWWYEDDVTNFILPLVKSSKANYVQYGAYYLLMCKFANNNNMEHKGVVVGDRIASFYKLVKKVLDEIDDEIILNYNKSDVIDKFLINDIYSIKHGTSFKRGINVKEGNAVLEYNGVKVAELSKAHIAILAVNMEKGILSIDGHLHGEYMLEGIGFEFYAKVDDVIYPVEQTPLDGITRLFGKEVRKSYSFHSEIDISGIKLPNKIKWCIKTNGVEIPLRWQTVAGKQTRVCDSRPEAHWITKPYVIKYRNKSITVEAYKGKLQTIGNELRVLKGYLKIRPVSQAVKTIVLRCLYWISRVWLRNKNIYITADKLYYGGDQGQYIFEYYMNNPKYNVDAYYVINKNSSDYPALKKKYGKHVVEFESIRNRLLTLNAKVIIATHGNAYGYCSIGKKLAVQVKELCNADVVIAYHGCCTLNVENNLNRAANNQRKIYVSSPYDKYNLSKPAYYLTDEMIEVTGLPRFDGLKSDDKRKILLSFTWRNNASVRNTNMGNTRKYNPYFKETDYYEIYNRLINDEKLLETARKHGYTISFLLHPVLSAQKIDFVAQEGVEILEPTATVKYETILKQASLMVTDYSGVQFDFAYMKKPVLYYHNEKLPPQYAEDDENLTSKKIGFGEVCYEHEEIVDLLCKYIERECAMSEKYSKRVTEFFKYLDYDNCKRIADSIQKYMANK